MSTQSNQVHSLPQGAGDSRPWGPSIGTLTNARDEAHDLWDADKHAGPDGFRRGHVAPYSNGHRMHIEFSGSAFEAKCRVARRDRDLTDLVEPMARLLYRALQVQALGAFDDLLFEDLPQVTKQQLVDEARIALHSQSPLYREKAQRAAKHEFRKSLRDAAFHFPDLNPVADVAERQRRQHAIDHVVFIMETLSIHESIADASRKVLTSPLTSSAASQVVRMGMRGARP